MTSHATYVIDVERVDVIVGRLRRALAAAAVTAHAAAQTTTTASDAEQKNAQALQHTEHKQRKIKTRSVYGE